jgi:L-amino acid N-acyltransferase YncA
MPLVFEAMSAETWPEVAAIYREGLLTGHASFAASPPDTFAEWCDGKILSAGVVARDPRGSAVLGWASLSKVSDRCVYAGVAEVSVYVAAMARSRGVGSAILAELIARSEAANIWTLQAGIFPENSASLALHAAHGFRTVGRREKVGKMGHGPLAGRWRDTLLLERRSTVAGCD